MNLLDVGVGIASLQDSQEAIIAKLDALETYLFNWVLCVGDEGISDENACFVVQIMILGRVKLRNIDSAWSNKCILDVEA